MLKHLMRQPHPRLLNNLLPRTILPVLMQTTANDIVFPRVAVDDVSFVLLLGNGEGFVELVSVEQVFVEGFEEE
jgi:hypothetical protein